MQAVYPSKFKKKQKKHIDKVHYEQRQNMDDRVSKTPTPQKEEK